MMHFVYVCELIDWRMMQSYIDLLDRFQYLLKKFLELKQYQVALI